MGEIHLSQVSRKKPKRLGANSQSILLPHSHHSPCPLGVVIGEMPMSRVRLADRPVEDTQPLRVVARCLPFADCRCHIAIAFDNSGFTSMLRVPIVSFGATKVRRESPDLECHYCPSAGLGDSIMNIREANNSMQRGVVVFCMTPATL